MDPATGVPRAIIDATAITEMRTGAVTAIGASVLARRDARVLGHVGARGTAYWNVRLLCRVLPSLEEIRVHSLRPESREAFARRLSEDLERDVRAVDTWEECLRGADVMVEASRLTAARAAAVHRLGGAGDTGDPLRHGERGRARAHRRDGQDRRR